MRRFSILGMMSFVLALGVALAALRNASELWADLLLLLDLAAVGTAILGVIFLRCKERAWWLGFGLFGGGYLILAFTPGLADLTQPKLGLSHVLAYVHLQVPPLSTPPPGDFRELLEKRRALKTRLEDALRTTRNPSDPAIKRPAMQLERIESQIASIQGFGGASSVSASKTTHSSSSISNPWQSLFPGAANYDQFQRVGHALFTLLAGLAGGAVACRFHARGTTPTADTSPDD